MGKASQYGFKFFKTIIVANRPCLDIINNSLLTSNNMVAVSGYPKQPEIML